MKNKPYNAISSIIAWCLYDGANSSFSVIVTTFVFATYFTTQVAENSIIGTHQWANAIALSGLIIALTSPLFGSIADHGGRHKRWLLVLTILCILSTAALWFAYPSAGAVYYTLTCVVIGTVAFEVGLVFYNAYLPYIVRKNYLGRISGWGWGCGYLCGIIALTLALLLFIRNNVFSLDTETFEQIRICGPFAAAWFALLAVPFFIFVPDIPATGRTMPQAIKSGSVELLRTLRALPKEKNILLYLIAHMLYADGLNTLFAFGGIYAAGTYHMSFQEVLLFGITLNISAGIGAFVLAWVDDCFGSKPTVIYSLIIMTLLGVPILLLENKYAFWAVALVIGLFIGPVQSASRSLLVRLIAKKEMSTEFFGLYALSGKITAFIGPWLLGLLTVWFDSQRVGMATILVFFVIGVLLLLPVKVENASHLLYDK